MANGVRYDIRVEWKINGVVYISIECIFQLPPYALIPKWFHRMAGGEWLMCDKQYMNQNLALEVKYFPVKLFKGRRIIGNIFFVICPVFRETRMWGQVWINDHIFGRLLDPQEDWICSDLDPTDFGDQPVLLHGTIQIQNTYYKYTLEHRFKYISGKKASLFYEGNCFVNSQTH